MTEYIVPYQDAESEFTEKRSRFITHLYKVETEAEARARIEEMKKKYYDARHNCWCYLLQEGGVVRYSDDGEPQGTAGVPVLNVLQKQNLTDVCCVVTRYFGGILLGGGGLVRAYSHSAALAVEAAQIQTKISCHPVTLKMAYALYGKVSYRLPQLPILQQNADFGDTVTLSLLVPAGLTASFQADMIELTNGEISIQVGEQLDADFAEVADRLPPELL